MKCVMHRTPGKRPVSAAQMSDEELLVSYRETRDRDLFTLLMQRYERELYSYLRRYLGNAEMAEDVFQTTFLQVHLKGDQFEEGRRFRPWVYTIATHQAIDAQRRNKRHRSVSLDAGHRMQDGDDSATELAAAPAAVQTGAARPEGWSVAVRSICCVAGR